VRRIIISYNDGRYSWANKWPQCADWEHSHAYVRWPTYLVLLLLRWLDRFQQRLMLTYDNDFHIKFRWEGEK
jgi:hypothetical protein